MLSNADGPLQRRRLAAVGLQDSFDLVVLSGETGFTKPDPAAFQLLVDGLALNASDITHVGDNPTADAAGAVASNHPAILIDRTDNLAPPPGARRITDLREVQGIISTTTPKHLTRDHSRKKIEKAQ